MNDFDPQAVLEATAEVLREQRAELDQAIAEKQAHLDRLETELGQLVEVNGKRANTLKTALEVQRTALTELIRTLSGGLASVKAQLSNLPPDPRPALAELKGRLDQIERQPGPAGKDADPGVVADVLVTRYADKLRGEPGQSVQGPRGPEGPSGADADPNTVAEKLFERHGQDLRGEDADPAAVAEILVERHADTLRGKNGVDGEAADPAAVAEVLAERHADQLRGKDADPAAVAEILVERHADSLRGFPGTDGAPGEDGVPGKDADPAAVALALVERHADELRGQPGQDADPEVVAEKLFERYGQELRADPETVAEVLVAKHADTLRGPAGKDADIEEIIKRVPTQKGDRGPAGFGIDAPVFDPGRVYREGSVVQFGFGQLFTATQDTADHPKKSQVWERIGCNGLCFCGIRDEARKYQPGDLYIDKGSCFIVLPDGKPKMFVQRGQNGRDGKDGVKGDRGRDGASIVAAVERDGGIEFLNDDGTKFFTSMPKLFAEHEEQLRERSFSMLDDVEWMTALLKRVSKNLGEEIIVDDKTVPLKSYRGVWLPDKSYGVGETVGYGRALYLCVKATRPRQAMTEEYWTKLAGMGGGGGGGGVGGSAKPPQDQTILQTQIWNPLVPPILQPGLWQDARAQYRAVDTIAQRDNLIDPSEIVKGSMVFVRDQNRVYVYEGHTTAGAAHLVGADDHSGSHSARPHRAAGI